MNRRIALTAIAATFLAGCTESKPQFTAIDLTSDPSIIKVY